jgi:hypothetical protein
MQEKTLSCLLIALGFKSIDDYETIIPLDVFDTLSTRIITDCADAHFIFHCEPFDKFILVNRILQFRYGKIIDDTKLLDELPDGFRIESMPVPGA